MRSILMCAALAATGCTSALRGPDTCAEIHFETTYTLARWAGWTPPEAVKIAAANVWTDQHGQTNSVATERRVLGGLVNPVTLPRILCLGLGDLLGGEATPGRAFGRRIAETTAWAVPELGLRLHFPARGMDAPVFPAFFVNPATGELEYGNAEGRRVLERAFLDLECHDDDREATLALLGIGLHTLQDSFKHCGFNAAGGHIGARPDPDDPAGNPSLALRSAEATFNCLRYARRLAAGKSAPPPPAWKDRLQSTLCGDGADDRWTRFLQEHFPEKVEGRAALLEGWLAEGGENAFDRALIRARDVLR